MTSLFDQNPPPRRSVSSIFFSLIGHGGGFLLLSYLLLHGPIVREYTVSERYSVREIKLQSDPDIPQQIKTGGIVNPDLPLPKPKEDSKDSPAPVPSPRPQQSKANDPTPPQPLIPKDVEGPQTLIQPGFLTHKAISEETPTPTVVIWNPEMATTHEVIPPQTQQPTTTAAIPSIDEPNEELNVSDLSLPHSDAPANIAPPAGTSTPLAVHTDAPAALTANTTSPSDKKPTPTSVVSISDVHMADGTVTLPPVNETHTVTPSAGAGHGASSTSSGQAFDPKSSGAGGTGATVADTAGAKESVDHISRSEEGKFGVIVVGSSVSDDYPETLQIWGSRVAYTAYLHVGLPKNWILQYSQLRSADLASGGPVQRIEAPWPYDIFRPNLVARDLNADVLMVHGVLNENGKFESLAVAFPANFPRARFVVDALLRWQFRPARQNGRAVPVEVLLIIPDQVEE